MNFKTKVFLVVNFLTILISLYKLVSFISEFKNDFFEWWFPMGKIFSYIHFYYFVTFFFIPVPFGVYLIALISYSSISIILLIQFWKRMINSQIILFSFVILCGSLGSMFMFIGE